MEPFISVFLGGASQIALGSPVSTTQRFTHSIAHVFKTDKRPLNTSTLAPNKEGHSHPNHFDQDGTSRVGLFKSLE